MFYSLPAYFKQYGLHTDVRTLLLLRKAIDKGIIRTFGDLFQTLKSIIVKNKEDIGPYAMAYYKYFLDIDIQPGEDLDSAVRKSKTFQDWKELFLKDNKDRAYDEESLLRRFINTIHITSFDIKEVLNGRDIMDDNNTDQADYSQDTLSSRPIEIDITKMADYSEISIDELLDRMEEIWKNQSAEHSGGSHWIGRGGVSPFGNSGAAKGGIRIGGKGGGKMARKVMGDSRFFPVDLDAILSDDNIDAALASLKGVEEESVNTYLDIPKTIDEGLENGGVFLPALKNKKEELFKVILLIDNGGYSMSPYVRIVQKLFRKMKTRFAHDLKTFYFHNSIYGKVFTDSRRSKSINIEQLCKLDPNYRVFVIGDASMAPYELDKRSYEDWKKIKKKFNKIAWLNPEPKRYWDYTLTITILKKLIPMFSLSPKGIENAIISMNKKNL